ncbi:hypothetical protein GPALN_014154 [Globodera pallida]|nr:hypothetical protein GPALN_014154 [Globodera pallida]
MVELFTGRKNAKKEDEDFTIPAEKAKEFLRKVFLALKDNNVIMPKVKEMDKKWICAAENQPKNSLKAILEGIFNIKFADQLKKYSKNLKPFLMILSVAIRICAIFGSEKDEYSLEAFLTAYKCANLDESQQPIIYSYKTIDCPTLTIYSYKILPFYKNNGQSWNLSDEIASIKFCKTKTDSAERNFNFLLKLSDVDVTPFAIVYLAEDIRSGIEYGKMTMEIEMLIKIFIFVFIKLLFLAKIDKVSSCQVVLWDNDCCKNKFWQTYEFVDCPGPFKPKCNIFGHNCVGCTYVYSTSKGCIPRVHCSCYYCCDPQYAESCPNGCQGCIKDGVGGCPQNSAAQFKSIGNTSSLSMHESETKPREHFDMVDVDKNGSISLNEAINHLKSNLKNGTSVRNLAVNMSWFAEIDHNGNNQIEPGEFDRSLI